MQSIKQAIICSRAPILCFYEKKKKSFQNIFKERIQSCKATRQAASETESGSRRAAGAEAGSRSLIPGATDRCRPTAPKRGAPQSSAALGASTAERCSEDVSGRRIAAVRFAPANQGIWQSPALGWIRTWAGAQGHKRQHTETACFSAIKLWVLAKNIILISSTEHLSIK